MHENNILAAGGDVMGCKFGCLSRWGTCCLQRSCLHPSSPTFCLCSSSTIFTLRRCSGRQQPVFVSPSSLYLLYDGATVKRNISCCAAVFRITCMISNIHTLITKILIFVDVFLASAEIECRLLRIREF